jgi:glycopeptide antibiotics resistance protein
MSLQFVVAPAIIAVVLGTLLSAILIVPLIAVQYRSWGTLSLSRLFLILAFMVYLIAIPMYTLLPIGIDVAAVCAAGAGPVTQLHPFQFVDNVRTAWASTTLRGFLGSDVVQEPVLNVIFFVPLGVFLRKLNRWPVWAVVLAGLGTSLLVELTQLTGNWGSAECAYRVFSVDDLILNTAGTIIGIIFAPLLELFPGVRLDPGERHRARRITRSRRIVQLFCDWLTYTLIATFAGIVATAGVAALSPIDLAAPVDALTAMTHLAVGTMLFVVIPLFTGGETLGERVVLIEVRTEQGYGPGIGQILAKAFAGWMPYAMLDALAVSGEDWAWPAIVGWAGFQVLYTLRNPEGLSMRVSRLRRFDRRLPLPET